MKSQQATVAGFVAFVNKQPARRRIDHEGGWGSCAVGHYAQEELKVWAWPWQRHWADATVNQLFQEVGTAYCDAHGDVYARTGVDIPWQSKESIMDVLNNINFHGGHNYGRFRTELAKQFPELGFVPIPAVVPAKPNPLLAWVKKKLGEMAIQAEMA